MYQYTGDYFLIEKITGLKYIAMSEDRGEFGYKEPYLDEQLDNDDDTQEVNRTQTFDPGTTSTPYQPAIPYHVGEQTEMHTMQHEQSGLPDTSYQEGTPLLQRTPSISDLQKESYLRQKLKKAVDAIKVKYPKAKFEKIKIRRALKKMREKLLLWGLERVSTRF